MNDNPKTQTGYKKILLPVIIIIITIALVMLITNNPPESQRGKPSKAPQMTVETITIQPQTYPVMIQSFGTVQPRTQSVLFAQVSGQITKVSKQFRAGGFFEQGDVLIQLDDRDHRAEVNIAKASLMSANQAFQEEEARVSQAKADWARLGNGKEPNALVLRQPQQEAAKAQVLSAQAQLDKAQLSLERTKIVAPFAGRVLKKYVDIGQVVSSNTQLADIFSVDYVEIRLPIKNKDLPLMKLPEEYRNAHEKYELQDSENEQISNVVISSDLLGKQVWQGQIVRTESAIDEMSQQLYVVAQIIRPYDSMYNQGAQIKMGQYVTAEITGRDVENALVIPSSAIYQGSYVYTVKDGLLMRKEIELDWQNGTESIVSRGLNAGDELVITALGQVSSGTPVAISGELPSNTAQSSDSAKGGAKSPAERRAKLEQMAEQKGISVDQLIAERKAKRDKVNSESTTNAKVNN
ncbi:efflux RND transporter periplasmic adaptor subunit [Colwellia echini]|uniref:Efflux RND transporter periplasmic adaptor subunit n=1 Tax=Colwellia echini TaxID=1982103 RepID=A0ABY3N261_9GAMM|nr:efflux RND transporter periplasmic adaptor subunit [Colwellia echini]TYK67451.1 efflux RND transporter periplasmic adaptor subunit [Colwellia echini]